VNWQLILNSIGLILDIVGAILVFLNSPEFTYGNYTYFQKEMEALENKARKKRNLSRSGMALIAFGFAFQLVSNLI